MHMKEIWRGKSEYLFVVEEVRLKDLQADGILSPGRLSISLSVFKNSYQSDRSLVHTQV